MSNCLITKTGKIIKCVHGQSHEQMCKFTLFTTLDKFLKSGVRMYFYRETLALESVNKPNTIQTRIINGILRKNNVFIMVTDFNGAYKMKRRFTRPIRRM